MPIEITKMDLTHLESIKENLEKNFDTFWTYNVFKEELENPLSNYIVATSEGEVVGYAGIWQSIDEGHITNIVTRIDLRRNHIATKMLKKIIEIAKKKKLRCVTLEVNEHNNSAIDLYKNFNFEEVGRRKRYYNNTDDAIIMTLNI